jgi:hypothetical protein
MHKGCDTHPPCRTFTTEKYKSCPELRSKAHSKAHIKHVQLKHDIFFGKQHFLMQIKEIFFEINKLLLIFF